ncbi:MAG: diaminopimelate decarboxylase [Spirochaetaceae bacterium 4572_7]|nr:MAG: diaminopimelate decarboxylase [Spirochaetaceae bacterium 4572_7]
MKVNNISTSFKFDKDGLNVSGMDIQKIIDEVGAPLFIYDADTIKDRYQYLRDNLPAQMDIFYAVKANTNIAIIKLLVSLGAGVEIASHGELYACKKVGVDPKNIVFGGPGKTDLDIEMAIDMGIYAINAESLGEIRRISRIANKKGVVQDVELRINPEFEIAGVAVSLGGGSKKFGMDSETIDDIIKDAQELPGVNLQGIHVFAGTGIKDSQGFLSNLENCFSLANDINNKHFKVKSIDVGGGIGIPYTDNDPQFMVDDLKPKIDQLLKEYPFITENGARIIAEPGRYLVGESGIYISEILDIKHSRGTDYIIVDGGAQHLLRPALIGTSQPTFNISKKQRDFKKFDVGGNLCTSIDFLGKGLDLPRDSSVGDYIGVFCSGAYGYADNGKFHIIRPRVDITTIVDAQSLPEDLI